MSTSKHLAGLLVAAGLLAVPAAALAQGVPMYDTPSADTGGTREPSSIGIGVNDGRSVPITEGSNSRIRDRDRRRPARPAAPAAPSEEEIASEARTIAATAAPSCQVTESALLGAREDGTKLYEVACASGPGYVLEAVAGAPKANDCVLQWSYGQLTRERDPAADVGLQCGLPGNQNAVQVIAAYGREAGVDCQVDQAVAMAIDVYEVGCAGRDGWRVEKLATGWRTTTCWQFALIADQACRFSSREESSAEWPKLVAGTDASACRIEDVAWMGDNPERGSFYELKCASGEGVIVRFKDGVGQQTYSCVDAEQIFRKPCSLTATAPATVQAPTGGRA